MNVPQYRHALPQLAGQRMLTDSGLETTLVFHEGFDLPCFAAFPLLDSEKGRMTLAAYYRRHVHIAHSGGWGFILDTPTWRANADWGRRLGYEAEALADVNRRAAEMLLALREEVATPDLPSVVSGNIGPRGDGYIAGARMRPEEAEAYHAAQIAVFADAGVDMITAMTIPYPEEAIGIARAAARHAVPLALSLTVETDGTLPSGEPLGEAIEAIDGDCPPAYFMVNCAHPDHFRDVLATRQAWARRILGVRANASRCSHAELDAAETLDEGDPREFGRDHAALLALLPGLRVFGGCCGTDHRHVTEIAAACASAPAAELAPGV